MSITYEQLRPYYKPVFMASSALGAVFADVQTLHSKGLAHWPHAVADIMLRLPAALLIGWLFAKIAASGVLDWPKR